MKRQIIFIHLLNNYTGSPNVLSNIIKYYIEKNWDVTIITNSSDGFLSNISGANYEFIYYKWGSNNLLRLILFLFSQIQLFIKIFIRKNGPGSIYYINTILPIGAVFASYIRGFDYIYHIHENMQLRKPLYILCSFVYKRLNKRTIFVSKYVSTTGKNVRDFTIVFNGIDLSKQNNQLIGDKILSRRFYDKRILMICSLKIFKGLFYFFELAKLLPDFKFVLVISDSDKNIDMFFSNVTVPINVKILSLQKDLSLIYNYSSLVISLTDPNKWIETFGLTIVEGFSYGLPAIVPYIGGPSEIVTDKVNGFLVDPNDLLDISTKLSSLFDNYNDYAMMSRFAFIKSSDFDYTKMNTQIYTYID